MTRTIAVVGAVIVDGDSILCAQRGGHGPLSGMWEFPGGKVEGSETPREALRREIEEELLCEVSVGAEVESTAHQYDFAVVHLTTYYCTVTRGKPVATEHQQLAWQDVQKLDALEWAPADVPAVLRIQDDFGSRTR